MARRSYKTELGCIACSELGELGAAKPHWRGETPQLLCAVDTHSLILANRPTILLLSWSSDSSASPPPLKIRPDLSPIDAESISALEWLAFRDHRVIVAGTSSGYVLFYSLRGELIHRQNMLQKWFEESHSRFWDQNSKSQDSEDFRNTDVKIPYQLWNIGKYGTSADAAITGIMPPPLMEQQQLLLLLGSQVNVIIVQWLLERML